eukprot:5164682-Amphidinium_carterae.1
MTHRPKNTENLPNATTEPLSEIELAPNTWEVFQSYGSSKATAPCENSSNSSEVQPNPIIFLHFGGGAEHPNQQNLGNYSKSVRI